MSNKVVLTDRIKELSHTQGTSAFTLDGELAGFSTFGDFYEYGDVVYYAATDGVRYEVGSGEYRQNGSNNELTRFPLRSSNLNSGPYYLNGKSSYGATAGQEGYFHPMYLTKSAALSVAGATSVHEHAFSGYHGVTFYMPNNHAGHAELVGGGAPATLSGVNYAASGLPINFPDAGIKEVYVTYHGKSSVFTGYGISGFQEPKDSGIAFWGSEQLINYDSNMLWSQARANLGVSKSDPQFAIDVGGSRAYSQIRASGFFGGGSGVFFSGGQALPQDITKVASGGRQLEPFFRNELDTTTGANAVFYLSGVVDERLCLLPQEKGTIFAGPASGCDQAGCSPDVPSFRFLTLEDIPDLSSLYATGEYTAGNGLSISPSQLIELTNLFKLGAVGSGSDGNDGNYIASDVYQNYEVGFSGVKGVSVSVSGGANLLRLMFDPSALSGTLDYKISNSYNGWSLHHPDTIVDTISSDQLLTISGVSGIVTNYIPSTNNLIISSDSLSGVLMTRINASGMQVSGFALNYTDASGNFLLDKINASGMKVSGVFADRFTEVSGQLFGNIQTTNFNSTTLVTSAEGINSNNSDDKIPTSAAVKSYVDAGGGAGAAYAGWRVQEQDTGAYDTIASNEAVLFSGASGIDVYYGSAGNTLHFSPAPLSGLLYGEIAHSGAAVSGLANAAIVSVSGYTIGSLSGLLNTLNSSIAHSGAAVSGLANVATTAVSGTLQYSLNQSSPNSAGSGLVKVSLGASSGTAMNMDIYGSGQLSQLIFNENVIRIGKNTIAANEYVKYSASGSPSVFLGLDAGTSGVDNKSSNFIGQGAGFGAIGSVSTNAIGHNSGSGSYNTKYSSLIGYNTAIHSKGLNRTLAVGDAAAMYASQVSGCAIVGNGAMYGASGVNNVVALGQRAASGLTRSSENIAIGTESMAGFKGESSGNFTVENNLALGSQALSSSSGLHNAIAIGESALSNASGYYIDHSRKYSSFEIAIGRTAGKQSFNKGENTLIGQAAGFNSSGLFSNIVIGNSSAYGATVSSGQSASSHNVMIGSHAGRLSRPSQKNVYIGYFAGFSAVEGNSSIANNIAIGTESMSSASGDVRSLAIGVEAGNYRNGAVSNRGIQNIMIGYRSGKNGSGPYNILIGDAAGSGQYLERSIVIQHNNSLIPNSLWVDDSSPEDYSLSIGRGIFQAYDLAVSQIGKAPQSVSDFSSNILRVATHSDSKVVLKTTRNSVSHTSADQIQSSLDHNDKANTIVNAYGFLQLPIATSQSGVSGVTRKLFNATGDEISRVEGTSCIQKDPVTSGVHLCVYIDGVWQRIQDTFQYF